MSTPTLINLPAPPSNPETPSDMGPGTPGSGTTSLSALSTTAIKDGHQGHPPNSHHHAHSTSSSSSTNTLDAQFADRISRLAGMDRLASVRGNPSAGNLTPGNVSQPPGYFDGSNAQMRERSTVGSASATGSVGGRTTWASSSDVNDIDKMSEDQDETNDGTSSMGGFSDEGNASLVGFGEGAASVADGPMSAVSGRSRPGGVASSAARTNMIASYIHQQSRAPPGMGSASGSAPQAHDAKMRDSTTPDVGQINIDSPSPSTHERDANATGVETAERIVRERLDEGKCNQKMMSTREARADADRI